MDWGAVIAGMFALAGFSGAFYSARKNGPMSLWIPLAYVSLMGTLQAFTYTIAGQCALPANQVATLLTYLHICFLPFFINAMALHYIDRRIAVKLETYVYIACFTGLIIMLIQLYPFAWAGHCQPGSLMCGETLCTLPEGWHLSWMVPVTRFEDHIPWYFLTAMALPLLYGSWRFMLAYMLCCLLPAYAATHSMNKWPGISTLLMIPFLLVLVAAASTEEHRLSRLLYWRTAEI